ncbi:MAG: CRTAC1 family protein [Deltaproteobacteria bacterium]|nr:CRTAC1 family protein [Deltaproteobacteria bacterium]
MKRGERSIFVISVIAIAAAILLFLPLAASALDFTDITDMAGVGDRGHGKGVAFADIDNDGDYDLYVSNKGGENVLYRNDGNGVFVKISQTAGDRLDDPGMSMGSCFGDFDNDGDEDLYVVKGGRYEIEANRLLRNDNGRFVDVTDQAGVGSKEFTYSAAFADVDNDGYLDLYLADYGVGARNILYHNNGDGTFSDVTEAAGVGDRSWSWSGVFADVNGDGFQDLYVVNGRYPAGEPNHLYVNNGDGTFRDVSREAGVADGNWGLGAAFADIDNDGDFDLFVSNYVGPNKMYLNDGTGHFTDVSESSGLADNGWGKGPSFGDVDNDGDMDLYEGDCKLANKMYLNNGKGVFTDIADEIPILKNETVRTKGTAFADIDGDGDLDLYVVNWGASNRLYRNEQNDSNFLKIRLVGTVSNADAVGARVTVTRNGQLVGFQEVRTLSGFCSQPPLELHFGLPGPGTYKVDVRFPSGISMSGVYRNGQSVTIVEGN